MQQVGLPHSAGAEDHQRVVPVARVLQHHRAANVTIRLDAGLDKFLHPPERRRPRRRTRPFAGAGDLGARLLYPVGIAKQRRCRRPRGPAPAPRPAAVLEPLDVFLVVMRGGIGIDWRLALKQAFQPVRAVALPPPSGGPPPLTRPRHASTWRATAEEISDRKELNSSVAEAGVGGRVPSRGARVPRGRPSGCR